jgi:Asp-tRNA(Asn)/Glu-tRNA(Gln) amidotransferase C subunit
MDITKVKITLLEKSIEHMLHGCQKKGDLSKKQIREQIHDLAKEKFSEQEAVKVKELMGRILDLTRNKGRNPFMRAIYYIFQGNRVHLRNKAIDSILRADKTTTKISVEKIQKTIQENLDAALIKAYIAKYRPHGFSKKEMEIFTSDEIINIYKYTGELKLSELPDKNMLREPTFLSQLMTEALEKKDLPMAYAILRIAKKLKEKKELLKAKDECVQRHIVQDNIIKAALTYNDKMYVYARSDTDTDIAKEKDYSKKMDLVQVFIENYIKTKLN